MSRLSALLTSLAPGAAGGHSAWSRLALQVVLLIDGPPAWPTWDAVLFRRHQIWTSTTPWSMRPVLLALLAAKEHPEYKARLGRWAKRLLKNQVEKLIAETRQECAGTPQAAPVEKRWVTSPTMWSACSTDLPEKGLFYCSGVVEADARLSLEPLQAVGHVLG